MSRKRRQISATGGFTLIELIAATAVFALMMVFTAQMIGHTTKITAQTSKQSDSQSGTQAALDMMARDLRNMVRTEGFTLVAGRDGVSGNDYIAFLCTGRPSASASTTDQNLMRYLGVRYQIDPATYVLVRIETPVLWNTSTEAGLAAATAAIIPLDSTSSNASDSVIRLEIMYAWKNGMVTTDIPAGSYYRDARYSGNFGAAQVVNLGNLSALVIAVVGMDQKSRDLLGTAGVSSVGMRFPSVPTAAERLPLAYWSTNTDWSGSLQGPVRGGLRTFQRVIPIN